MIRQTGMCRLKTIAHFKISFEYRSFLAVLKVQINSRNMQFSVGGVDDITVFFCPPLFPIPWSYLHFL